MVLIYTHWRLDLRGRLYGQNIVNTFPYTVEDFTDSVPDLGNRLITRFVADVLPLYIAFQHRDYTLVKAVAYCVGGGDFFRQSVTVPLSDVGSVVTTSHAPWVTAVVRRTAIERRGRRGFGKLEFAGVPQVATSGGRLLFAGDYYTAITDFIAVANRPMSVSLAPGTVLRFYPGLLQRLRQPEADRTHRVVQPCVMTVRSTLGQQRHRLARLGRNDGPT